MRLLDRYLLRELLIPLGYCLGGFLILWVAFDLLGELNELQAKKLLPRDIVRYYLLMTPEFLVLVMPIALLLAMLYSLTNHARHQEITAIRTAGVSLGRLCLPYLGVGLFASLLLFVCNEFWAPNSLEAAEQILSRRLPRPGQRLAPNQVQDLCFNNEQSRRYWRITTYDPDSTLMTKPQVVWSLPDGSSRWMAADKGLRINGVWTFYKVREYRESPMTNALPVPSFQAEERAYPEFSETPEQIKSEIKLAKSLSLRQAKKSDIPLLDILNYLRLHPHSSEGSWLHTKLHGRLAAPWTCLVVVLIAIPFSVASGRRNVFAGVASSIGICFIYFVLQQLGLALGTGGFLAPWLAAWLPNLCFGLTGVILAAKVR